MVDKEIKDKINWFIYAYETFDEREIASHLLEISLRDIREVLSSQFEEAYGREES